MAWGTAVVILQAAFFLRTINSGIEVGRGLLFLSPLQTWSARKPIDTYRGRHKKMIRVILDPVLAVFFTRIYEVLQQY